ncbi:hypothetical protein M011DRAFT_456393 [Sporormia fimetaria CBS 119925]|uniref:BTB domain-containing protein n=1 Tax=Sporormia fimetaria CBS 119925 TaxID=1340428 RepID=A0A6A6VIT0_9PLEO|nr:hypothetical protein M011DRAFT_456393 [Sporormia fimetaria CBS 119925]
MEDILRVVPADDVVNFEQSSLLTVTVQSTGYYRDREFTVEEQLLTSRSKFFRKAVNDNGGGIVTLYDADCDVFRKYLSLVYRNKLPIHPGFAIKSEEDKATMSDQVVEELLDIYLLAEQIEDTTAKNSIVTYLYKTMGHEPLAHHPSGRVISGFYNGIFTSDNKCRKLLVDKRLFWAGSDYHFHDIYQLFADYPPEYMRDLLARALNQTDQLKSHAKLAFELGEYLEDTEED